VADDVAHASYKTPTACAQAVVADVRAVARRTEAAWQGIAAGARIHGRRQAEQLRACGRHVALATRHGLAAADRDLTLRGARVGRSSSGALARSTTVLDRAIGHLESGGRAHLRAHEQDLAAATTRLVQRAPRVLSAAARDLDAVEAQVRALDPARVLAKGWSVTRDARGRVVRSVAAVAPGDELVTTLADGDVRSTVSSPATPTTRTTPPRPAGTPDDDTPPPGSEP